jgi:hypothetical protein
MFPTRLRWLPRRFGRLSSSLAWQSTSDAVSFEESGSQLQGFYQVSIEGGCFCGEVRYEITGKVARIVNCHCTMCRRTSGAPFVTWLVVALGDFQYLKGQPSLLKSSERGSRYFCSSCGTPIACANQDHLDYIDITLGSLDDPAAFTPDAEFFTDTRLEWLEKADG